MLHAQSFASVRINIIRVRQGVWIQRAAELCKRGYQTDTEDAETRKAKKPAELEGKNWRDLRKKQRLGHDEWQPQKRLTHDQMEHLRNLKRMQPHEWTNKKLADKFGISIQSVARILKSKFDAPPEVRARQDAKADQQRDERRERFYEKLKRTHKTCTNFANVDLK